MTPSFVEYAMPVGRRPDHDAHRPPGHPRDDEPARHQGRRRGRAIAAPPAVMNAVLDALRPLGVTDVPMPCTPYRVWTAIQQARRSDADNHPARPPRWTGIREDVGGRQMSEAVHMVESEAGAVETARSTDAAAVSFEEFVAARGRACGGRPGC